MATRALILIPFEQGQVLPAHLFSPIVGLPFLDRLIFSLWRAGLSQVSLMVPSEARTQLENRLTRVKPSGNATLEVFSSWQDLGRMAPASRDNGSILVMAADMLATPDFLAKFSRFPVPADQVALVVADCQAAARSWADRAPACQVSLENHLVTSLRSSTRPGNHCALSMALFSRSAWRDWQSWLMSQALSESASTAPNAALFPYLARQAQEKRVLGVESDAVSAFLIQNDQDAQEATTRLINTAQGSPWGEGYLESSVNRRLARKILLHLTGKAPMINPNFITFSDLLLGLVAVAGFLTGNYWVSLGAALLLPLVIVLDTLDGLLARLTFQESREGRLLDLYGDTILNLLIFCGIAIGQYQATGRPLFLALLIPLTIGYIWCWRLTNPLKDESRKTTDGLSPLKPQEFHTGPEKELNETTSRDFFYLIILAALFNILDWLIIATAIGANLFGLFLFWRQRRER